MARKKASVTRPKSPAKSKSAKRARSAKPGPTTVFQFKITLIGSEPPIWRRIQVEDCTLDKLHEHIQTAMGWTNSHLHDFLIAGERYGDPDLLGDDFEEFEGIDSTGIRLHKVVPTTGKRFRFKYEYDFGDGWEHEICFEGCPPKEPGTNYPLCVEGERACPPEDVGGIYGYESFLEIIRDKSHSEDAAMLRWAGDHFDPEAFDPAVASNEMRQGLPDWREMDEI